MAQTPQEFFKNNMKWIALLFFCLFMLKSVQSCNRNMGTRVIEKEYKHTVDSLNKRYDVFYTLTDSIKKLQSTIDIINNERKFLELRYEDCRKNVEELNRANKDLSSSIKNKEVLIIRENTADTIKRK